VAFFKPPLEVGVGDLEQFGLLKLRTKWSILFYVLM